MVSTKLRMTVEQASALRVILKFEFVGRTGELLKVKDNPVGVLSQFVKNAELWSRLDNALAQVMGQAFRDNEALALESTLVVPFSAGQIETIQGILKDGIYQTTLQTANTSKSMQTTMGSMIPVAIVQKNVPGIKAIFEMSEESPMVFFPMKAAEGKN